MNRYYDYEEKPSCGPGNHPKTGGWTGRGTNMNGTCIKCGHDVETEAKRIRKMVREVRKMIKEGKL